ncbi:hypothetical protein ABT354_35980 [Streptomyces sp. NPDC000594]|uniref:hypothetical protein n=1 Tax=Streptomyces sp. NPDC000594 TaxID=3154261 RepID=UPI003319E2BF
MAERAAQYALWHPRYVRDGDWLTCLVDVAPLTDALLSGGDQELFGHFAQELGMGSSPVADWSMDSFNTPFYSYEIDADEFGDWMTPAWRVRLTVENRSGAVPAEPASPVLAWGYDKSWFPHRAPWDWNAHDTVVIALNGPEPDLDFLKGLKQTTDVEVNFYRRPKFNVSQVRIGIGRVLLPDESDTVFDVVTACHRQAMIVHADMSRGLLEQSS